MIRLSLITIAAAGLLAVQTAKPQTPTFRSTADVVPLFVTVTDKTGRLAPDLVREDFTVNDNGKPQPLTLFDNSPQPIRLVVLIDVSGSMTGNVTVLRRAAAALITALAPGDLARIGTFGHEVVISPTFTRDAAELMPFVPEGILPGAPTPLWRAVDTAMTGFTDAPPGRRVVLILSDSKDGGMMIGKKFISPIEISDRAQKEDVMIYGVGVRSSLPPIGPGTDLGAAMASTYPDPSLGRISDDTGGGYFELRGRDDLMATFARVIDELHHQYLLGFTPPARDGKTHKIEVKLRNKDMKPRVRKSYVAPK